MNIFQKTAYSFERIILDWVSRDAAAWAAGTKELDAKENGAYYYIRAARVAKVLSIMNQDIQLALRGDYDAGSMALRGARLASQFPASVVPTTWLESLPRSTTVAILSLLTIFAVAFAMHSAREVVMQPPSSSGSDMEIFRQAFPSLWPIVFMLTVIALLSNMLFYRQSMYGNFTEVIDTCIGSNSESMRVFDRLLGLFSISSTSARSEGGGGNGGDDAPFYDIPVSTTTEEEQQDDDDATQEEDSRDPKVAAMMMMAAIYRKHVDAGAWPRPVASAEGDREDDGSNWPTTALEDPLAARYIADTMKLVRMHGPTILATLTHISKGIEEEEENESGLDPSCIASMSDRRADAIEQSRLHAVNVLAIIAVTTFVVFVLFPSLQMALLDNAKEVDTAILFCFRSSLVIMSTVLISRVLIGNQTDQQT